MRILNKNKKQDSEDQTRQDKRISSRKLSKICLGDELKKVRAGLLVHQDLDAFKQKAKRSNRKLSPSADLIDQKISSPK